MGRRKVRVGQIWQGVMGDCMVVVAIREGIAVLRPLGEPEWEMPVGEVVEFLTLEVEP